MLLRWLLGLHPSLPIPGRQEEDSRAKRLATCKGFLRNPTHLLLFISQSCPLNCKAGWVLLERKRGGITDRQQVVVQQYSRLILPHFIDMKPHSYFRKIILFYTLSPLDRDCVSGETPDMLPHCWGYDISKRILNSPTHQREVPLRGAQQYEWNWKKSSWHSVIVRL